jgi:hypothetical protein
MKEKKQLGNVWLSQKAMTRILGVDIRKIEQIIKREPKLGRGYIKRIGSMWRGKNYYNADLVREIAGMQNERLKQILQGHNQLLIA